MKKWMSIIVMALATVTLAACGEDGGSTLNNSSEPDTTELESSTAEYDDETEIVKSGSSSTEYGVKLYDGEYISIVCDRITEEGIEFSITSKLQNNPISVYVDRMALDGVVPHEIYNELGHVLIEPGMTITAIYGAEIKYTDHKLLSGTFEIFNDEGNGVETVDIVDFDLGGNENLECEEPDGVLVHDSEFLSITYAGADDNGIRFRNYNKMDEEVTIVFDYPFYINNKAYNEVVTAMTLPAHSKSDYYFHVKDFNPDYAPESIESMQCSGYTYNGYGNLIDTFNIDTNVSVLGNSIDEQNTQSSTEISTTSIVENTYNTACNLTIDDLDEEASFSGTRHYYKGLIIQSDDEEWLTSSRNTEHTLSQGAIYRTIASYLEGFSMGWNDGRTYAEIMTGVEWTSQADFEPYATNASGFICTDDMLTNIMKKFETVSCVNGEFDHENKTYHIFISDLANCAEEMMISEEMLGYIFAMLDEYAPTISFDGNTCTLDYEPYG